MDSLILSKSGPGVKDKKCKTPSYPTIKNKKVNMSKTKNKMKITKIEMKKLDKLINMYIVSQQLYQDVPSMSDVRIMTKKMKDAVSSQELEQVKQKLLSDIGVEELTYSALLDDTVEDDTVVKQENTTRTPLSEFDSNSTAINYGAAPRYSMELSPIPAYNSSKSYTNRHHNTSYTNRSNNSTNRNTNTTTYSSTSSHSSTTSSKNLSILNRSDAELSDVFSKLTLKKSSSRDKSKGRKGKITARHNSSSDNKENLGTHLKSRRPPQDDVLHGTQRKTRATSQKRSGSGGRRPRTKHSTVKVEMDQDDVEVKHEALNVSEDNIVEGIDDLEDFRHFKDDTFNETTVSTRSQRAKREVKAKKDDVQTKTGARKPSPPRRKTVETSNESTMMQSMLEDTVVPNNKSEESSDEFYSQLENSVLSVNDTKYEDAMDVTTIRQTRTRTRAVQNRKDIETETNSRKKETTNRIKGEAVSSRTTRKNISAMELNRHHELNNVDSSIEDSDSENNNTIVKVDTKIMSTRTKRSGRINPISEGGISDSLKTHNKQIEEKTEIVDLTSVDENNETVINMMKSPPTMKVKPSCSVTVKESPQIIQLSPQIVKQSPVGNRSGSDDPVVAFNRLLKNVTVRRGRKIVVEDADCTVVQNVTSSLGNNNVNTTSSMERSKVSLAPGKMWKRSLIDRSIRDRESHKFCRSFVNYSEQFSSCVSFRSRRSSLLSSRSILSYSTTDDTTLYETVLSSSTLYDDNEICRSKILDICKQNDIVTFEDRYPTSMLKNCRKIGEGVYGEVFKLNDSVIKIMPIEGSEPVNGEDQKQFKEIFSEIMVTKETSDLQYRPVNSTPCFTELLKCSCVKGRYPTRLISLWEEFAKTKKSYNDHPKMFDEEQVFIILELKNGGVDSGDIKYRSPNQTYSMILQVLFSLAVAEVELEFEHRDLHMSNILVSATESDETGFLLDDMTYEVKSAGVRPTIIDFTISRCFVGEKIMYYDLSQDEELFQGEGDYQFEMYRMMRSQCGNNWQNFTPKNNVVWIHYLTEKALNASKGYRYLRAPRQSAFELLQELESSVLSFDSCYELVQAMCGPHTTEFPLLRKSKMIRTKK